MKRNSKKRATLAVLLIALILTATVGGTIAYLVTKTDPVVNVFQPAEVTSEVIEPGWTNGSTVKQNVTIKNTGDVSAFIRAAIIVTWQDGSGNVYSEVPGTDDYTLTIGSDWEPVGNYYYYKNAVDAGAETHKLIDTCTVIAAAPAAGYTLHVEIVGSAIQSTGIAGETYKTAWTLAAEKP